MQMGIDWIFLRIAKPDSAAAEFWLNWKDFTMEVASRQADDQEVDAWGYPMVMTNIAMV